MSLRSLIESVLTIPLLLATTFYLVGCQSIRTIHTDETDEASRRAADSAVEKLVHDTCERAWLPTPWSSRDTPETQLANRANNAARKSYCRESGAPD